MGKDLKGKELGVGITQEKTGLYSARYWFQIQNNPDSQKYGISL